VGDASDGNTCPEVITRTYRIEDDCGNFIEVDQEITINDDIDPAGTAPADVAVQCIGDVPAEDINDVTGVSDNCTANPTVTHVGDVSDNGTCPEIITRTYRIEDDCNNFIEVDQTITINDDTDPTASNPAGITVECATDVPAADPTVVTDAADNCTANPTVTHVGDVSDGNVCDGEVITRTYQVEDDCGNFIEVEQTITIDSYTPTFTLSSTDPTECGFADGTITLSGLDPNTDYDLQYDDPSLGTGVANISFTTNGAGEYIINGLEAGTYSNFIINPSNCPMCDETDNSSINLADPNAPTVDAGTDQTICEGEDVTLTADNPDGANISWNNGVDDGVAFTPNTGTVDYTVTAELAGCVSTDAVTVTVNPLPDVNAGNDIEVCEGEEVILTASGADSYSWDNGVTDGVSFVPTTSGTYTVTGTTLGCENTDELEVVVVNNPEVTFEADNTVGCAPFEVNFVNTTEGDVNSCTYTMADGTQIEGCDISYVFTEVGCHDVTLEVENTSGCVSTTTIEDYICIEDDPIANFSSEPDELTNVINEAEFTNSSVGASTYDWSFGDGGTSISTNPLHEFTIDEDIEDYVVELIAYSDLGCSDTVSAVIPVKEELLFFVPNTFTPDSDDFNETFKPVFTSGFDPQDYTLYIFNRWGELIFESNNTEIGWGGTYGLSSNEIVKEGTYVWKVEFKTKYTDERKVEVGHVNVLR
ncbi:MAG: PKD domain-containing protein, partial [Brumimicrobium sp.]